MLGLIGILLALTLLITLAYRGHSVLGAAPVSAAVAVLFAGAPLVASYTQVFMPALGNFVVAFFPLFITGAIFGKLMSETGYARPSPMPSSTGWGLTMPCWPPRSRVPC